MKKTYTVSCFLTYVIALIALVFPHNVYAYLDPGSGSYILQVLLGALLGASYLVKVYWGKIKSFFRSKSSNKPSEFGDEGN